MFGRRFFGRRFFGLRFFGAGANGNGVPAVGSQNDVYGRLKLLLPNWFGGSSTLLDAVLQGYAWAGAYIYSLYVYAKLQTRILTATDGWLDMIAADYFGTSVQRTSGQTDTSFRATIQSNLLRERATRKALINLLTSITGRTPIVTELNRPSDTGAYGHLYGYGAAGAYGSVVHPFQCFLKVYRPLPATQWYGLLDSDIYTAIESVRPAGTIIWTQLLN